MRSPGHGPLRSAFCNAFPAMTRPCAQRRAISARVGPPTGTAITWNVNSLRALLRNNPDALREVVRDHDPDVLCLQETKLQEIHEVDFHELLPGFETILFSSSSARKGYAGTAVISRARSYAMQRVIGHDVGDLEGRHIMIELPGAYVVCVYTMNAGADLKRLDTRMEWDSVFRRHVRNLRSMGKPVIVLGDLNVARGVLDVHDEQCCAGLAGFTDAERASFEDTLETCGLVDVFRDMYPDECKYTFWNYRTGARKRDAGWRIDYALVTEDMMDAVKDVRILDAVMGSDHCPVAIYLAPGLLA